jgi:hypothetical protein
MNGEYLTFGSRRMYKIIFLMFVLMGVKSEEECKLQMF